ncbi:hypothetical protein ACOSP7_009731 [Xanthoceras sorbifolium]
MKIGCGSVLTAEVWGILEGLKMARAAGCRKVFVESDSAVAVRLINGDSNLDHPYFNLIQGCKDLISEDWCCSVSHVYREGNSLVDGLANLDHHLDRGIMFFVLIVVVARQIPFL